ncbi:MAG: hypothetical protein U5K81_13700 [Trueperaceae bacterium]|nr:hypothetical protein [Trueperaceae bacterium]
MDITVNVWAVLVATVVYFALVGIGIGFALMSVTFMYESRTPALFLIDGGYHVLALVVAGAILGAWPPA